MAAQFKSSIPINKLAENSGVMHLPSTNLINSPMLNVLIPNNQKPEIQEPLIKKM